MYGFPHSEYAQDSSRSCSLMVCWWRLPSSGKTASQVIASSRCFCSLATWETCVTPGTWQTGHLGNQQGVHVVQPGGSLELLPRHWIFNPSLSQIVRGETKVLLDVQQAKGTTLPENFASWTAIGMALLIIILLGIVQNQGTCFAPRREIFPLQFL